MYLIYSFWAGFVVKVDVVDLKVSDKWSKNIITTFLLE